MAVFRAPLTVSQPRVESQARQHDGDGRWRCRRSPGHARVQSQLVERRSLCRLRGHLERHPQQARDQIRSPGIGQTRMLDRRGRHNNARKVSTTNFTYFHYRPFCTKSKLPEKASEIAKVQSC